MAIETKAKEFLVLSAKLRHHTMGPPRVRAWTGNFEIGFNGFDCLYQGRALFVLGFSHKIPNVSGIYENFPSQYQNPAYVRLT